MGNRFIRHCQLNTVAKYEPQHTTTTISLTILISPSSYITEAVAIRHCPSTSEMTLKNTKLCGTFTRFNITCVFREEFPSWSKTQAGTRLLLYLNPHEGNHAQYGSMKSIHHKTRFRTSSDSNERMVPLLGMACSYKNNIWCIIKVLVWRLWTSIQTANMYTHVQITHSSVDTSRWNET